MSTFFRALEQADEEQALRRQVSPPVGDRRPTSPEPLAPAAPPVVPELSPGASNNLDELLVSLLAPGSFEAEQYRALRHLVEQRHKASGLSVVAVSSPGAGDGKTTTAINLAGALAQARDARVLLVDADLRNASIAGRLGLDDTSGPGLVGAILDPSLRLSAAVQARPHINLSVLPAGRLPVTPYELLKSPRLGELLAEARQQFDYIVLDTPPLVSVPDCQVIGKWVDGFLIVVTAHRTPRKLLAEALKVTEPAKVVGLVFNGDDRHLSRQTYAAGRSSNRNGRRHTVSDD
jgi:capsular exopolysaccharide synthesis family protein